MKPFFLAVLVVVLAVSLGTLTTLDASIETSVATVALSVLLAVAALCVRIRWWVLVLALLLAIAVNQRELLPLEMSALYLWAGLTVGSLARKYYQYKWGVLWRVPGQVSAR